MNKRQREIWDRYCKSQDRILRDVYGNFSINKECAYLECMKRYQTQNGKRFRIIGHNSQMFSVGWQYLVNEKLYFHYETNQTIQDWEVK